MNGLINDSIFNSQFDLIVIPVSTYGDTSRPFREELSKIFSINIHDLKGKEYSLGEVRISKINNNLHTKYIAFACSVEDNDSSYTSIYKIGKELGLQSTKLNIKNIACPILGTGAGGLDYSICLNILHNSFNEASNKRASLHFYIPDKNVHKKLSNQNINKKALSTRLAFDAEVSKVVEAENIKKLQFIDEYYFEFAKQKFIEYSNYQSNKKDFYKDLIHALKESRLSFSQFLSTIENREDWYRFLVLCGELVSYIDYRAYFKNLWNKYPDKRVIANSFVRQTNWIINLIEFKDNNHAINTIKSTSIKNAIIYLLDPERSLSMLSENHRKLVFEKILLQKYDSKYSNEEIITFFNSLKIKCRNPLNKGTLYTSILYSPQIKELWQEESEKYKKAGRKYIKEYNLDKQTASFLIYENLKNKHKKLDLGKCGLNNLLDDIPELFECTHLEELILSNEWAQFENGKWRKYESQNNGSKNIINVLPTQIGKLVNLKKLVCGGDWNDGENWNWWGIEDTAPISKLINLEYLNLSNNIISSLKGFSSLKKLKIVHINNNQIVSIISIKELANLEEVYLSNNEIINVYPIKSLENLKTLDLHANKIKDIRSLEKHIDRLSIKNTKWEKDTINIAKNPLEQPPIEVIVSGKDAVLQYFEDIKSKDIYINKDIKVILVGNSEVGKTTLAKYLNNEKDLNIPHSATLWMNEIEIESKYEVVNIGERCTIHLFDFGGHDYFHDTHHMFYSTNTIYILLWDTDSNRFDIRNLRQEDSKGNIKQIQTQDYPLNYWLDSIKYFTRDIEVKNFEENIKTEETYNSPVLVIQNKVEDFNKIAHLNNEILFNKYPFIYEIINASIIEKRNMGHFDNLIREMLDEMDFIGAVLPGFYKTIKESISNYSGNPVLSIDEFYEYCNNILSNNSIDKKQAVYLASYLKQIGIILWYPENGNDKIYINKKWIIEKIYLILENLDEKKGEFDLKYVERVLSENNVHILDIINIMCDFKMIFKHPHIDKYIAPLYLPVMPVDTVSLFIDNKLKPYRRIEYTGFIHKHVILSFFQKYGQLIIKDELKFNNSYYYWKDGLVVKDPVNEDIVMVKFNFGNGSGNAYIDIFSIRNKENKNDLFIKKIFTYIIDINEGYEIEEMVTLDGKEFISTEVLKENAKNGKFIFSNQRISDKIKMLEGKEKIFKLKDYQIYIGEGTIKRKKVVISYSKKDLIHAQTLRRYLQPLVDNELIEQPWYCTNLKASEEWEGIIKEKFETADIVFFMVSEHFYTTKFIVEYEITSIINRYDKDKSVKIIPIILEFYNWKRKEPYNLQRFTALPYQAKPINDFSNPKIAWYAIAELVKRTIEKDLDISNEELISRELQDIFERQVQGKLDKNSL